MAWIKVLLVLFMVQACHVEEQESEKIMRQNRESAIATPVLGKTLLLQDDAFVLSCMNNEYSFWMSNEDPSCTPINKVYNGELQLTIQSGDKTKINLRATHDRQNATLTIDGTLYHCYYYNGKVFTDKGEEVQNWLGLVLLSRQIASRPSEIEVDQVDFVGVRENNLCNVIH